MKQNKLKLALGPIQYFWPARQVFEFYEQVVQWPVDIVYLGENVCARRREIKLQDWLSIAEQLTLNGKEVVLSTLALLEADSELSQLKKICDNGKYKVEANDMAAIYSLADKSKFVIGPHINCYNAETLTLLSDCGATRWVMPVEMSATALAELLKVKPACMETEVFSYGRMPLSFSARCFTARAYNKEKDQCEFRCRDDEQGLALSTQEGQRLFTINGVQLQSGVACNLMSELTQMNTLGVNIVRLSPQIKGMQFIVQSFRDVLDGQSDVIPLFTSKSGEETGGSQWCNGYWYDQPGIDWRKFDVV